MHLLLNDDLDLWGDNVLVEIVSILAFFPSSSSCEQLENFGLCLCSGYRSILQKCFQTGFLDANPTHFGIVVLIKEKEKK